MQQSSLAGQLAAADTATLSAYGTSVVVGDPSATPPVTFPAEMIHSGHELTRSLRSEGESEEKRPVVFVFPAAAWGVVREGTQITVGTGVMQRVFRAAAPLHPQWVQGQVVELVVAAFSD